MRTAARRRQIRRAGSHLRTSFSCRRSNNIQMTMSSHDSLIEFERFAYACRKMFLSSSEDGQRQRRSYGPACEAVAGLEARICAVRHTGRYWPARRLQLLTQARTGRSSSARTWRRINMATASTPNRGVRQHDVEGQYRSYEGCARGVAGCCIRCRSAHHHRGDGGRVAAEEGSGHCRAGAAWAEWITDRPRQTDRRCEPLASFCFCVERKPQSTLDCGAVRQRRLRERVFRKNPFHPKGATWLPKNGWRPWQRRFAPCARGQWSPH
jgi:hypothetical protein